MLNVCAQRPCALGLASWDGRQYGFSSARSRQGSRRADSPVELGSEAVPIAVFQCPLAVSLVQQCSTAFEPDCQRPQQEQSAPSTQPASQNTVIFPLCAYQSGPGTSLVRYHAFSSTARGFIIDETRREQGSHTVSGGIPTSPLDAVTCHSGVCVVVWSPSFWP